MSRNTTFRSRRRGGLAIVGAVLIVAVLLIGGLAFWMSRGTAPANILTPIISAVTPPGSVIVDVYGEFTRTPSLLGNTPYRVDFKLISVPPGTEVKRGLRTPAGVTATPLPATPVVFALGGPVVLAGVGTTALTPTTNPQGVVSLSVRARGTGTGKVTATVTIGARTGQDSVTFESDQSQSSQ